MEYGAQLVTAAGAMQGLLWPADNWATQAVVMYNIMLAIVIQFLQTITPCSCFFMHAVAVPYRGSAFGRRFQSMEFGGLGCTGTESTLQKCSVSSGFVKPFSSFIFSNRGDYSGVECIPRSTGTPQISQSKKIFPACMGKIVTLSPQLNFVATSS